MNVFNRVAMILLSLLALGAGVIFLLLLNGVIQPNDVALRRVLGIYSLWRAGAQARGGDANTLAIVATLLAAGGLVVFLLEVVPLTLLLGKREAPRYVVQQDALGAVTVDRAMVKDLVRHEAEATPGVLHADSDVTDGAQGLRIYARTALTWDAVAPSVGQQLQARLQDVVQHQLGLPVAEVRVATHAAAEKNRRVA